VGGNEFITTQRGKLLLLDRVLNELFDGCDVVVQTDPVPFDILGLPEIASPIGSTAAGLPIGTILGGLPYAEDRLLSVVAAYQAVTDWHLAAGCCSTRCTWGVSVDLTWVLVAERAPALGHRTRVERSSCVHDQSLPSSPVQRGRPPRGCAPRAPLALGLGIASFTGPFAVRVIRCNRWPSAIDTCRTNTHRPPHPQTSAGKQPAR
jgi:hypothetical protein